MKKIIQVLIIIIVVIVLVLKNYYDLYKPVELEVFNEKNSIQNQSINIIDGKKMSNEEGILQKPYTIKITNNKDHNIKYNIYLKEDQELEILDNCTNNLLSIKDLNYSINNEINNYSNTFQNNNIIYTKTLKPKETEYININVWINTEAPSTQDKHFHLKILVDQVDDNIKLIDYLKSISNTNTKYYIDTDKASEMYKINNTYRYIGTVPNNYIYFNCINKNLSSCRLFRIIGIDKVLLKNKKQEYRLKIIEDNYKYKSTYEDINYNIENENIESFLKYENGNYIEEKYDLLNEKDYKYTFSNGVNKKCYKDITKCNSISYINGYEEWLKKENNIYKYISNNNNVVSTKQDIKKYYRPVLYLKENLILIGGNGTKELPYIIDTRTSV